MADNLSWEAYDLARNAIEDAATDALQSNGIDAYAVANESGEEPTRLPDGGWEFEVAIRPN